MSALALGRWRRWLALLIMWLPVVVARVAPAAEAESPNGRKPEVKGSQTYRLTQEELRDAVAVPDADGARWRSQITPCRLDGIIGRPSRFAFDGDNLMVPFRNFLIKRILGSRGEVLGASGLLFESRVEQVTIVFRVAALTLAGESQGARGQVLCFAAVPFHANDAWRLDCQGSTPWRLVVGPSSEFVTCGDDGWMRVWDVPFRRLLARFPCESPDENGKPVRGEFAAFSPHGRWLATAYKDWVTLRSPGGHASFLWQPKLDNWQHIVAIRFDRNGNNLLAFLQDSRDDGGKRLRFLHYNVDTQKEDRVEGSRAATWGFALPDDETVVSFDGSAEIVVWNVEKGEQSAMFKAAPEHVHDLQLAPAGDTVATVGDDNVVKFWDTANWKRRETKLNYKHDGAKVVQFSPDGKYLVTLSDDGWLKCWDAPDFAADRRPTVVRAEGEPPGARTVFYSDGTAKQFQNWTVKETLPDGTVKTYKQQ